MLAVDLWPTLIGGDPVSLHTCFTKVNDNDITVVIISGIFTSNPIEIHRHTIALLYPSGDQ